MSKKGGDLDPSTRALVVLAFVAVCLWADYFFGVFACWVVIFAGFGLMWLWLEDWNLSKIKRVISV